MKLGVEEELCSLLTAFTWTLPTLLVDITSHIPASRVVLPTIPREEQATCWRCRIAFPMAHIILFWCSICLVSSE